MGGRRVSPSAINALYPQTYMPIRPADIDIGRTGENIRIAKRFNDPHKSGRGYTHSGRGIRRGSRFARGASARIDRAGAYDFCISGGRAWRYADRLDRARPTLRRRSFAISTAGHSWGGICRVGERIRFRRLKSPNARRRISPVDGDVSKNALPWAPTRIH